MDNKNILLQLNYACSKQNFNDMLAICKHNSLNYFGMFISTTLMRKRIGQPLIQDDLLEYYKYFSEQVTQSDDKEIHLLEENTTEIKIQLLCNWTDTRNLTKLWAKMSKSGDGVWDRIRLVIDEMPDYWIIINKPPLNALFNPKKTIVFQMEPLMKASNIWGDWARPNPQNFLHVFTHQTGYNNIEWHLDLTWKQLKSMKINKLDNNTISTIVSDKYWDDGHIKRIDFIKFLENKIDVDVFGSNVFCYKNYKGNLPYHNKNDGLLPYKYTFNAENHAIENYFTEKVIDGILAECLVFYWGCPNLHSYINKDAFIYLPLDDHAKSYEIIKTCIENDEWSKRIDIIRSEKQRILDELQFFPRINKLLQH